jgi:hypothetical protein
MEYNLNFEVLSIKFDLYSGYSLNNIQQEHLKLDLLKLYYLEQQYCGLIKNYFIKTFNTILYLTYGMNKFLKCISLSFLAIYLPKY